MSEPYDRPLGSTARYPVQVYLIRHGIAAVRGTYPEDSQRPLTDKGIWKTEKIAQRLMDLGLQFDQLLTSPLVRAVQTAEILCRVGVAADYEIFKPLAPGGSLSTWLAWLSAWGSDECQSIGLVGHEPDLSQWAQMLVHGGIDDQWRLKKAGIIGLHVPAHTHPVGGSELIWLAPPRFIL